MGDVRRRERSWRFLFVRRAQRRSFDKLVRGAGRGVGGHRFWLPWVSANHLYGITGLEEYDPALFKKLSTRPAFGAK